MAPMAARMSGNVYRCGIGLATAMVWGHVIGFRFERSWAYTIAFCLMVLLIGFVVSLVGDLIGMVSTNPEATTHIILLPVLTLGMVSVGFQPAEQFPEWIQPFVRNQVHSQFVYALRALAGDGTGVVTHLVSADTGAGVAGRHRCGHRVPLRTDTAQAPMSTVENRPENSLHQLVVHTWVQTLRLLVRWRSRPPDRYSGLGAALRVSRIAQSCFRQVDFGSQRPGCVVRHRTDGRSGRGTVRINRRRDLIDARARRRAADTVLGPAGAPRVRATVTACRRGDPDSRHNRACHC